MSSPPKPSTSPPLRDAASNQLLNYYNTHKDLGTTTTSTGTPNPYINASMTVGKNGPQLLQDLNYLDDMSHFDRERIPERVVHAKGTAAFGQLVVTHDITQYTAASVFSKIGKKTPMAVRFSQVGGSLGSQDTVRDPRGFALKFHTEDGIWDIVGNNTPIFFIRDALLFPPFIHTQKRNPVTNLRDWDAYWDFLSLRAESTGQVMFLYSDRGIPDGHRHMDGFGANTFSMINSKSEMVYCKFIYKTDQGIKNLDPATAQQIAGADPDYSVRDLYNAIAVGDYPSWSFYIQVMTPAQAAASPFNPFDVTLVWPHAQYPLIPVGKFTLNRNASNFFAEVEQLAYSPSNLIPGIGASPDRMLQGRLFAYHDTHVFRLGANFMQLPVNCPYRVRDFQRDGKDAINNQGGAPNYHPNSFGGPVSNLTARKLLPTGYLQGEIVNYDSGKDNDNFNQPRDFYRNVLDAGGRTRLIENIVSTLKYALPSIQERAVHNFSLVDADFGRLLTNGLKPRTTANL